VVDVLLKFKHLLLSLYSSITGVFIVN